jgi:hypothetical protein
MSRECDYNYCFYLDPEIVEKIFAPRHLESIHQAAMIALYTLDAQGLFDDYPRHLPKFLLCEAPQCGPVLEALVACGLLRQAGERVELVHRPAEYRRAKGALESWAEMSGQSVAEFERSVEERKAGYTYSRPVPKLCPDTSLGG